MCIQRYKEVVAMMSRGCRNTCHLSQRCQLARGHLPPDARSSVVVIGQRIEKKNLTEYPSLMIPSFNTEFANLHPIPCLVASLTTLSAFRYLKRGTWRL